MYHLRRIFLSRVGHRTAHYPGNVLSFADIETDRATHSVLLAQNGSGKTTALSFAFSVFEPSKNRFVQTLQRVEHRYRDYFSEQPGIVALELEEARGLLGARIVVGYANQVSRIDAGDQPLFFSFRVSPGKSLDELPWPGSQAPRESHVKDWPAVLRWSAEWQSRTAGDVGMQVVHIQNKWRDHLRNDLRIPLDLIVSQIDLARTEGGLSKMFEGLNTEDKVLEMLVDMTGLTDRAERKLPEIREMLVQLAKLPEVQRDIAAAERLLGPLERVGGAARERIAAQDSYLTAERDLRTFIGALCWKAGEARSAAKAAEDRAKLHTASADRAAGEALRARIEAEGWRVRGQSIRLADAERRDREVAAARLAAEETAQALPLSSALRGLRAHGASLLALTAELEALWASDGDRLRPVVEAGTRFAAARRAQLRDRNAARESAEAGLRANAEDRVGIDGRERTARSSSDRIEDQIAARRRAVDAFEAAAGRCVAAGFAVDGIDAAASTLEADVADARAEASALSEQRSAAEIAAVSATAEARRLEDSLAKEAREAEAVRVTLDRRRASVAAWAKAGDTIGVYGADDVDPLDPGLPARAAAFRASRTEALAVLDAGIRSNADAMSRLEDGMTKADADVVAALALVQDLGVHAHYAPAYLSETVPDGQRAKLIAESDPARMFHGILVDTEDDLRRVEAAFDAAEWKLRAPVMVSVISHDVADRPDYPHLVLSPASQAPYHAPTRRAEIEALDRETARMQAERVRVQGSLEMFERVQKDWSSIAAAEADRPARGMEEALVRLADSVERLGAEAEARRESASLSSEDAKVAASLAAENAVRLEGLSKRLKEANGLASLVGAATAELERHEHEAVLADGRAASAAALEAAAREREANDRTKSDLDKAISEHVQQALKLEASIAQITYRTKEDQTVEALDEAEIDLLSQLYGELQESAAAGGGALEAMEARHRTASAKARDAETSVADAQIDLRKALDGDRAQRALAEAERLAAMREPEAKAAAFEAGARERALSEETVGLAKTIGGLRETVRFRLSEGMEAVDAAGELALLAASHPDVDVDGCDLLSEERRADARTASSSATEGRAAADREERAVSKDRAWAKTLDRTARDLLGRDGEMPPAVEHFAPDTEEELDKHMEQAHSYFRRKKEEWEKADASYDKARDSLVNEAKLVIVENATASSVSLATRIRDEAIAAGTWDGAATEERVRAFLDSKRNRESALGPSKAGVLVALEGILDASIGALKRAMRATIPADAGRFAGLKVLKSPVDFAALEAANKAPVVARHFDEVLAAHGHATDGLNLDARAVVVGLLKACLAPVGQKSWGIRILSPVAQSTENVWQPVDKITGSGGQVLTAAFLLYLVVAEVRSVDTGSSVFLLLDNPIGVASSKALVQTMISVATKMGIQFIAMTAVKEPSALECFGNVVENRVHPGPTRAIVETTQKGASIWTARYAIRYQDRPEA